MSNLFWTAVAAGIPKNVDRDALEPGNYEVSLAITGTIDGEKQPRQQIRGTLALAPPFERSRELAPATADLVAALLFQLSSAVRRRAIEGINPKRLEFDDETKAAAVDLIRKAKTAKLERCRGAATLAKK